MILSKENIWCTLRFWGKSNKPMNGVGAKSRCSTRYKVLRRPHKYGDSPRSTLIPLIIECASDPYWACIQGSSVNYWTISNDPKTNPRPINYLIEKWDRVGAWEQRKETEGYSEYTWSNLHKIRLREFYSWYLRPSFTMSSFGTFYQNF